jgi:imidazolonepropionase
LRPFPTKVATTLFTHLKGIWLPPVPELRPLRGAELKQTHVLENAWLLVKDGRIDSFGSMDQLPQLERDCKTVDGTGRYLLPGLVDCHTHLVFAAWRENEMEMRLSGKTYLEIAAAGGGILNSALRLQETEEQVLFESALRRLQELVAMGTVAVEIKSGYGLSTEAELKMLRVVRKLKEVSPIPIRATFLGAHAIPKKYSDREEYIGLILNEMIPAVAKEGLADYCDVFCDTGFFTPEETVRILNRGKEFGLIPKVHANELARSGGVQAGVEVGALSADHLECMGEEELALMEASETLPVLLPGTAFFLGIHPPDARTMIERNLPVVLASDYNPGTCPSGNMEFVLSLASALLKMSPAESLHAATQNAAFAMGVEKECGRIEVGRRADFLLTKPISSLAFIAYHFGQSAIEQVWIGGEIFSASR